MAGTRHEESVTKERRQKYRGRGLARQAKRRVQTTIGEEVMGMDGGARRKGQKGSYILVDELKSCMQREGVGLYRALGWRGTKWSWDWSLDEHATQEYPLTLSEESARKKRAKVICTLQRRHAGEGDRGRDRTGR